MIKLSKRLQRIADYVTAGGRVADIGSDHALLPVYLLQSGISRSAIAGELNAGPYMAAKKQAADAKLAERLQVRQGDGLAVLQPGETDTITIAGMGGLLMREILETGRLAGKLEGVTELVLQPNVGEDAVRIWLLEQGWYLASESILEEDGKIYEVLHAKRVQDAEALNARLYDGSFLPLGWGPIALKGLLVRMGPHLIREGSKTLVEKWRLEIEKLERIRKQMSASDLPEAASKREQFQSDIDRIEEVLECLRTARH